VVTQRPQPCRSSRALFGRFEFGDVAFDRAAAVVQRESVSDGVLVLEQSGGEPSELGDVAGLGGCDDFADTLTDNWTRSTHLISGKIISLITQPLD
jgi:hypothetical protein